jgi:NADH-ubiquinone oxidoreductase chain 6
MGLVILILTILLAVNLGSLTSSFWLSYVLILVLLGGLLVIFVYISLLASNELFSKKSVLGGVLVGGSFLVLLWLTSTRIWITQGDGYKPLLTQGGEGLTWVCSFYSRDLWGVTIFFVYYLLLTLIVVVNITKYDQSSLRAR